MQPQGLVVVAVVVVRISITLTEPRRAAVAVGSVFWVLVPAVLLEPMPGSGAPEVAVAQVVQRVLLMAQAAQAPVACMAVAAVQVPP